MGKAQAHAAQIEPVLYAAQEGAGVQVQPWRESRWR
ncbi:hypothetical protein ACP4OV_025691 [Aristida adscensionis]